MHTPSREGDDRIATTSLIPTLKLRHESPGDARHRVQAILEGAGSLQTAATEFDFDFTSQDREDLRWYLEDFLQYPEDPAPRIADRIAARMAEIGEEFFRSLFHRELSGLWSAVRERLGETRIEVSAAPGSALPWELLRDGDQVLALRSQTFVRSPFRPNALVPPRRTTGVLRVLLVISRPGGITDVPFRSVARRLVTSSQVGRQIAVQVLRPPTFARLREELATARDSGKPFDVVHFDGHGVYEDLVARELGAPPKKPRGYLVFEDPSSPANQELVDGARLGQSLAESGASLLVLNACRSAATAALVKPAEQPVADRVRPFSSLAEEALNSGLSGVVAMGYNVYVATAAQFVAHLYSALAKGSTLSQAVTIGRRELFEDPIREVAFEPRQMQDWVVPVLYEAAPSFLAAAPEGARAMRAPDPVADEAFIGRDETLLTLDRAFDAGRVVLLHGFAGAGKTSVAREFCRWYSETGGLAGPLLFTTFQRHAPLAKVLNDAIEPSYADALVRSGRAWTSLTEEDRVSTSLELFQANPPLWIWDDIEAVADIPRGGTSPWTPRERDELLSFLRAARDKGVKFLLVSLRDESAWLGNHVDARIPIPAMRLEETMQIVGAVALNQRRSPPHPSVCWPLLDFAQGNPLAVRVLAELSLRQKCETREDFDAILLRLRAGEGMEGDKRDAGNGSALAAAIHDGLTRAFTRPELEQIALLRFFQGWLQVSALPLMGNPDADWCVPSVRGLSRDDALRLLNRAAEAGLLLAHGPWFRVHPAVPIGLHRLIGERADTVTATGSNETLRAREVRAFVGAMGYLGSQYAQEHAAGNHGVLEPLGLEEFNLLYAKALAQSLDLWEELIEILSGLQVLYRHSGRRAEWGRLVEGAFPVFVAPDDQPRAGREYVWSKVMEWRADVAQLFRRWDEAERLHRLRVERNRRGSGPILPAAAPNPSGWRGWPARAKALARKLLTPLSPEERNAIRTLAVSIDQLGHCLYFQRKAACADSWLEAHGLYESLGQSAAAAEVAAALGDAYVLIPAIRDLAGAERWYDKCESADRLRALRGRSLLAFERFRDAKAAGASDRECLEHLNGSLQDTQRVLLALPDGALTSRAESVHRLGMILFEGGHDAAALDAFREAIRCWETARAPFEAAGSRYNIAVSLYEKGRRSDALEFARAALRGYESVAGADEESRKAEILVGRILQEEKEREG